MIKYKLVKGEIWKETRQQLKKLNAEVASAATFVREIERGNLDFSFDSQADSELKTSLVNMRDQMKKYALSEKQRNWVNEGLAQFVQILRSGNNEGRQQLADNIIRNLVVYLKANQGALFALNDDDPNDMFLEMEACYAYERKKYFHKRIELGEGLAGQVALEKSTLYLTDVPKDFIKITSGLGEALPRNVLLVPLKLEEKVYGVVEIASFQIFQNHEIDFVEKLSESIASSMASVKNNEHTRTLLKETRLQAEQLRAQEEEVRQNMEELSATQEAMQRAMKEVEVKESYVSQILNTSQDVIYTVDREFRILMWNSAFAREADRINVRIEKGMEAFGWSPEQRRQLIPLFQRALDGETFEFKWEGVMNGKTLYFLSLFAPIKSESGEVMEVGIYAKDITPMVEAQQETARLLHEAQQQAEELKAQEEELRQNMEELSATQETMQRAMTDLQAKEAYTTELLNATNDLIYTVDKEFNYVSWNKAFERLFESENMQLVKGTPAFEGVGEYRKALIPLWSRAFAGEKFEYQWSNERQGGRDEMLAIYAPVRAANGEIIEVVVFSKDISSIVKAQQETANLLKNSQQQSEQLKAQEEELRQNMEELSATQETMEQKTRELEVREEYLSLLLNASQSVIFTVDHDFKLVTWNNAFEQTVKALQVQPEKGMIAFQWRPLKERQHFVDLFKRVFNGETFETMEESRFDGKLHYLLASYSPIRDQNNEIVEAAIFAKDVSALVNKHNGSADIKRDFAEKNNGKPKTPLV